MKDLQDALDRLNAIEAQRDAACQQAWAVVKVVCPVVADVFSKLYGKDERAARWICGPWDASGLTDAELIAAGRASDVIRRLGQIAAGDYT
ncbi:hypothetical protein [Dokdonella soli]|uniref:DUF2384 domain-containing protein n=1 Tax=Dokdonella soli TaxID=529810 RepID=A0ABN1IQI9_9GAMM